MILPSLTFPGSPWGEPFKEVLLMATIQLGEPKLGDTRDVAETFEGRKRPGDGGAKHSFLQNLSELSELYL